MSFLGGLFGGGYQPEMGASEAQAQQLYDQQQKLLQQQQAFTQALAAQTPQAIANQQMVARQLAGQAQGLGPSVAQKQLAETTGQNIAQQAALMASQRGASGNVGLLGRQASQIGAQAQQQAAGQAATLRAQEQLAAQQGLAGLAGQQLGQVAGSQQLGMAGTQAAQQNVLNAIAQQNQARAQAAQQKGGVLGGLLGAAGTILGGPLGGALASGIGGLFSGGKGPKGSNIEDYTSLAHGGSVMENDHSYVEHFKKFAEGGIVPAMVSPGERYLPPSEVSKVADGKKSPLSAGEKIPGKAKVSGDSLKNDTVKKNLKEGGIVIPRSVMQSEDPAENARRFVAAILAQKQSKR